MAVSGSAPVAGHLVIVTPPARSGGEQWRSCYLVAVTDPEEAKRIIQEVLPASAAVEDALPVAARQMAMHGLQPGEFKPLLVLP